MFAFKPWKETEIAIRILLIAVIFLNALAPTTALAKSQSLQNKAVDSLETVDSGLQNEVALLSSEEEDFQLPVFERPEPRNTKHSSRDSQVASNNIALQSSEPFGSDTVTELISVSYGRGEGDAVSSAGGSTLSADGRYVVFSSSSSNIVVGDTNGAVDVFVYDRLIGRAKRVSVSSSGVQAVGNSCGDRLGYTAAMIRCAAITPDGRYIVFSSYATNLVSQNALGQSQIYIHDRQTGTTSLVSGNSFFGGNGYSHNPAVSADGRYVAFESLATNLAGGVLNNSQVFVKDRQTGTITAVSVNTSGGFAPCCLVSNEEPSISADGRYVAFVSSASDLVAADTNNTTDVFVRDLQTNTTTLVSVSSSGVQGNGGSYFDYINWGAGQNISADGRYVVFFSSATNFFAGDANGSLFDVFVHDRQTGTTTHIPSPNYTSWMASISADGRVVAFVSGPQLTSQSIHTMLTYDLQTGATTTIQSQATAAQAPALSADGQVIAFLIGDTYTPGRRMNVAVRGRPLSILSGLLAYSSSLGLDGILSCAAFCSQGYQGGPINTRTGAYDYSATDISIQTTAGELTFARTYSSATTSLYSTKLGYGWTHNHDLYLAIGAYTNNVRTITVKGLTANQYVFTQQSGSTATLPEWGVFATLTQGPSSFILTDKSQGIYEFNLTTGRLISYTDVNGQKLIYEFDGQGRLTKIRDQGGLHYLTIGGYVGNDTKIRSVADQTGRSVTYYYDPNGDLDYMKDLLQQTWDYEYESHRMTRVLAPGPVIVERTEYDPQGRAWRQYDGNGKLVVKLTFNADGTTTIEDALTNIKTDTYSSRNILSQQTDPFTSNTTKTYDSNFRPAVVTDPAGNTTKLGWSSNGANLTHIEDALHNHTDISYGTYNNPTSIIDALENETTFTYGNPNFPSLPTRIEYPLSFDGGVNFIGTDYKYYDPNNPEGQPVGKLELLTDAKDNKTHYTYTSLGQLDIVITAYETENPQTTNYDYDALGRLVTVTDPSGVITRSEYDNAGRLTKTIHNAHPTITTQNYQDKFNIFTTYFYDLRGNQIAVMDTFNTITRTYYDLENRPVTVVQNLFVNGTVNDINTPIGSIPPYSIAFPDRNIRTDTEYDDAGNVIVTYDPLRNITRTYYDKDNRPKLMIKNWSGIDLYGNILTAPSYNPAFPDQNVRTEYFYAANGNVIATKDTLNIYTRTYYDELNRPELIVENWVGNDVLTDPPPSRQAGECGDIVNVCTENSYDKNGNLIATQDPNGIITRTYYDALNRPISVVHNLVGQLITDEDPPARDPMTVADSTNIRTDTWYDEAGNIVATQDPRGIWTRTYYDEANRPVATLQNWTGTNLYGDISTAPPYSTASPDANIWTSTAYDQNGHKATTTDPLGHVTKYVYDNDGQLLQTIVNYINNGEPKNIDDQWNIVTSYEYDALGRQVKTTDTLDRVTQSSYDALGRLLSVTQNYLQSQNQQNYKDASGNRFNIITKYAYDALSNQIAVTTKAETTSADVTTRTYYDDLSRPVTVVRNFTGLITDSSPPNRENPVNPLINLRTDTAYLGNGAIDSVKDELGKITNYSYDDLGRLISALDPLSNPTNYEYDANGNQTLMTTFETVTQAFSTKYEYDGLNRLKVVIENNREDVLPFKDTKTNVRTEYTYDAGGNRLSIRDGESFLEARDYRTIFIYDALGRLKTERNALNHETNFSYNVVASLTRQTDALGQRTCLYYDALNRLIGKHYRTDDNCPTTPTSYDISFDYDALGRRIDMDDGPNGFNQSTRWEYNNLDLPKRITDPFGTAVSYDYDALGNRTNLNYSDKAYTYEFDALNRLFKVTGSGLSNQVTYGYYASGNIKSVTRPNGVSSAYNYYDNGWLKDITHNTGTNTLASYQYEYYNNGNRSKAIENVLSPSVPTTFTPTATYTPTNTATATSTSTATSTATATATAASLIQWNTFAGSSSALDAPTVIFVDSNGNSYVTGHSWAAWGLPVRAYQGGVDSFVAKFDVNGNRLWHTFLGGAGNDYGYGIAVDGSGNIYVTGDSYQNWGSPSTPYHGSGTSDAFLAKLNASGSLLWNTFLGQASDDIASSLALDGTGNIYIGGYSYAGWGTPVRLFQAGVDAFVAKLNSSGAIIWNTFLGGADTDTGTHIALDASNNIFISGESMASWGTPIRSFQTGPDVFAVKLNANGTLAWNTFLGGTDSDASRSINLDPSGNIYVGGTSGQTWGTPVRAHQGWQESFLAKLTPSGSFSWNTFLGSPGNDWDAYTATDTNGNVFVAGYSHQTWGTPVQAFHGGSDVFVTAVDASGNIYWHTFLGGVSSDEGGPIAWKNGNVYVGGSSYASWGQPVNPFTSADVFLAKLTGPVSATPTPTHTASSTSSPTNTFTFTPTMTDSPTVTLTPSRTSTASMTATASQTPTLGPSDLIFADDFESGNLSAWTSSTTDNGDLSVSAAAALIGSQGLQALIDDLNGIYVTDDTPSAEPRYRARFYFDPNSITMADKEAHFIFKAYHGTSTDILRVEFQRASGVYQIRGGLLNDASSWVNTAWYTITDTSHFIEVDWRAATSVGANNGELTLWLDGNQQPILNGVDNDTWRVDRARLGTLSGLDAGTSGIYYLDAFESRRTTYIGLAGSTPTLTPTLTPTITNTPTPTSTPSITPTFTRTNTPLPATATFTPSLTPTATNTPQAPTATSTLPGGGLTYFVSKTTDTNDGTCNADCSLREAVRAANAHAGADVISIPAGTYNLTIAGNDDIASKGDLDLTDSVTLQGAGSGNTIIDATSLSDRIFHLPTASIAVTINDLTIQNGNRVGGSGGGINANATNSLILNRVIVKNNAASESAGSGGSGGGIYLSSGAAFTANNSAIVNNSAIDNVAGGAGGGIYFAGNSTIALTNVTISGNSTNMHGAGIRGYTGGVSSLTNVTISGNTITNSTFDGMGGGVNFSSGATVSIKNSIIAGNTDLSGTIGRNDCSGSGVVSLGHNLVGDNSACAIASTTGDQFGTSASPINPQLGPLQDNGGNTLTQALLLGSPAIDAADTNSCPSTDQRGFNRVSTCDKGAYEFNGTASAPFRYANFVVAPAQQSGSLTFTSMDDASIANDAPSTNYGSEITLQTDNSPIRDFLLKFNVSGVNGQSITSAKVRLYNVDAATKGGDFYPVSNNTWQQNTVTWNNAPTAGSTQLASLGAVSANTWYEVDITSFITGDGTYSLRISSKSSNGADYSSQEGANPPQLVITLGTGTPTPTPIFTLTATPTYTSTARTPTPQSTSSGALPDLIVWQMKIEYQNTNCLLPNDALGVRIWVTNSGTAAAGSFIVSLNGQQQAVSSLAVGEIKAVFFPTSNNPVTAMVDATNTIEESNESNNSTTQTLPVPTQPFPCTATPVPPTQDPITINYMYDPLDRLIQANYSNNDYYHYAYDAVGNRETQTSLVGGQPSTSSYVYDDANRLIRVNDMTYNWDNNGNLLNDGTNAYTYDPENRLKTQTGPSGSVNYSYNGLGDRLQQTVSGNPTTTFTMDLNAGLTQVLSDGANTHVYGLERIAQVSTGTEYFLGDALGSVRQLANMSGSITYTKAYDPYGVVTTTTGTSQSAYGYTGEFTSNQMVYLRARFYSPGMGRFLTRDAWQGSYNQPLTLNRWNYTTANPINLTDPSGYISESDNIRALIISEALRIDYNVNIMVDWGYMDWLPGGINGIPVPNLNCDEWQYGNWRNLQELEWVRNGVHRLAMKMGGPAKFKAAMKNRPVEILRVKTLPPPFEENTGLALPEIPIYFMVNGLTLPDSPFDIGELRATYTTIHELGHVWDIRSGLSPSIHMALHLGNTKHGNDILFNCLLGPADPTLRFLCAVSNWQYNAANETAPGNPNKPYASFSLTEDWAEAVAYTTYPEYGQSIPNYNEIGPIRKIYVEMLMRDIR